MSSSSSSKPKANATTAPKRRVSDGGRLLSENTAAAAAAAAAATKKLQNKRRVTIQDMPTVATTAPIVPPPTTTAMETTTTSTASLQEKALMNSSFATTTHDTPSKMLSIKTPSKHRLNLGPASAYYFKDAPQTPFVAFSAKKKSRTNETPNKDHTDTINSTASMLFWKNAASAVKSPGPPGMSFLNNSDESGSCSGDGVDMLNLSVLSDTTELTASNFVLAAGSRQRFLRSTPSALAFQPQQHEQEQVDVVVETLEPPSQQQQQPSNRKPLGVLDGNDPYQSTTLPMISIQKPNFERRRASSPLIHIGNIRTTGRSESVNRRTSFGDMSHDSSKLIVDPAEIRKSIVVLKNIRLKREEDIKRRLSAASENSEPRVRLSMSSWGPDRAAPAGRHSTSSELAPLTPQDSVAASSMATPSSAQSRGSRPHDDTRNKLSLSTTSSASQAAIDSLLDDLVDSDANDTPIHHRKSMSTTPGSGSSIPTPASRGRGVPSSHSPVLLTQGEHSWSMQNKSFHNDGDNKILSQSPDVSLDLVHEGTAATCSQPSQETDVQSETSMATVDPTSATMQNNPFASPPSRSSSKRRRSPASTESPAFHTRSAARKARLQYSAEKASQISENHPANNSSPLRHVDAVAENSNTPTEHLLAPIAEGLHEDVAMTDSTREIDVAHIPNEDALDVNPSQSQDSKDETASFEEIVHLMQEKRKSSSRRRFSIAVRSDQRDSIASSTADFGDLQAILAAENAETPSSASSKASRKRNMSPGRRLTDSFSQKSVAFASPEQEAAGQAMSSPSLYSPADSGRFASSRNRSSPASLDSPAFNTRRARRSLALNAKTAPKGGDLEQYQQKSTEAMSLDQATDDNSLTVQESLVLPTPDKPIGSFAQSPSFGSVEVESLDSNETASLGQLAAMIEHGEPRSSERLVSIIAGANSRESATTAELADIHDLLASDITNEVGASNSEGTETAVTSKSPKLPTPGATRHQAVVTSKGSSETVNVGSTLEAFFGVEATHSSKPCVSVLARPEETADVHALFASESTDELDFSLKRKSTSSQKRKSPPRNHFRKKDRAAGDPVFCASPREKQDEDQTHRQQRPSTSTESSPEATSSPARGLQGTRTASSPAFCTRSARKLHLPSNQQDDSAPRGGTVRREEVTTNSSKEIILGQLDIDQSRMSALSSKDETASIDQIAVMMDDNEDSFASTPRRSLHSIENDSLAAVDDDRSTPQGMFLKREALATLAKSPVAFLSEEQNSELGVEMDGSEMKRAEATGQEDSARPTDAFLSSPSSNSNSLEESESLKSPSKASSPAPIDSPAFHTRSSQRVSYNTRSPQSVGAQGSTHASPVPKEPSPDDMSLDSELMMEETVSVTSAQRNEDVAALFSSEPTDNEHALAHEIGDSQTHPPLKSILNSARKVKELHPLNHSELTSKKSVVFGSPEAAEFNVSSPSFRLTPMPSKRAKAMFSIPRSSSQLSPFSAESGLSVDGDNQTVEIEMSLNDVFQANEGLHSNVLKGTAAEATVPSFNQEILNQSMDYEELACFPVEDETVELDPSLADLVSISEPRTQATKDGKSPGPAQHSDKFSPTISIEMSDANSIRTANFSSLQNELESPDLIGGKKLEFSGEPTEELDGNLPSLLLRVDAVTEASTSPLYRSQVSQPAKLKSSFIPFTERMSWGDGTVESDVSVDKPEGIALYGDDGQDDNWRDGFSEASADSPMEITSADIVQLAGLDESEKFQVWFDALGAFVEAAEEMREPLVLEALTGLANAVCNEVESQTPLEVDWASIFETYAQSNPEQLLVIQESLRDSGSEAVSHDFKRIASHAYRFVQSEWETWNASLGDSLSGIIKETFDSQFEDTWKLNEMKSLMDDTQASLSGIGDRRMRRARRRSLNRRKGGACVVEEEIREIKTQLDNARVALARARNSVTCSKRNVERCSSEEALESYCRLYLTKAESSWSHSQTLEGIRHWRLTMVDNFFSFKFTGCSPKTVVTSFDVTDLENIRYMSVLDQSLKNFEGRSWQVEFDRQIIPSFIEHMTTFLLSTKGSGVLPSNRGIRHVLQQLEWALLRVELVAIELTLLRLQSGVQFSLEKSKEEGMVRVSIDLVSSNRRRRVHATFELDDSYPFSPTRKLTLKCTSSGNVDVKALDNMLQQNVKPGFDLLSRLCKAIVAYLNR